MDEPLDATPTRLGSDVIMSQALPLPRRSLSRLSDAPGHAGSLGRCGAAVSTGRRGAAVSTARRVIVPSQDLGVSYFWERRSELDDHAIVCNPHRQRQLEAVEQRGRALANVGSEMREQQRTGAQGRQDE
jgi:hypothetical protein